MTTSAMISLCCKCSMPIGAHSVLVGGRIYHIECCPYSAAEAADKDKALAEIRAENERLRTALKPFAHEAEAWSDMWEDSFVPIFDTGHLCEHCGHANADDMKAKFTVGDLREASRSLGLLDEAS